MTTTYFSFLDKINSLNILFFMEEKTKWLTSSPHEPEYTCKLNVILFPIQNPINQDMYYSINFNIVSRICYFPNTQREK